MASENLKKVIFVFFPLLVKNFSFDQKTKIDNTKFIDFDLIINKKDILLEGREEFCSSIFKQEIQKIAENGIKKAVLINYPQNTIQYREIKEFVSSFPFIQKYLIVVTIKRYELIKEIQKERFVCPLCKKLHLNNILEDGNVEFFCSENQTKFNEEDVNNFCKKNIDNYFQDNKEVIETLLSENSDIKIFNNINIVLSDTSQISGNFLYKKILDIVDEF